MTFLAKTFGSADLNALGRTLTRAQVYLMLHGEALLQRQVAPPSKTAPGHGNGDTRKMSKAEYMRYIRGQMGTG